MPGTLIKPKKLYAWDRAPEPTGPDEYDVTGAAGSIGESVGGLSTISDAAVLTQAVKKINEMATTIRSLARESRVRDQEAAEREESLGQVIVALKGQVSDLYGEVDNLRQDTSMAALFQGLEPALRPTQSSKLTPQDRAIIAGEVAGSLNLGSFAKAADLKVVTDKYVSATVFEARLKREVEGLSLVTHTQLQNSLPTPNVLPPNLEDRLRKLEIEIAEPGGVVMAMD